MCWVGKKANATVFIDFTDSCQPITNIAKNGLKKNSSTNYTKSECIELHDEIKKKTHTLTLRECIVKMCGARNV